MNLVSTHLSPPFFFKFVNVNNCKWFLETANTSEKSLQEYTMQERAQRPQF